MTYTDKELDDFIAQNDLTLLSIDTKNSVKTNLFIPDKNFGSLLIYLSKLKALVIKTKQSINIDNIINEVALKFQNNKTLINIPNTLVLNVPNEQVSNSVTYSIERLDDYIVEISNNTNEGWLTDNLIVQVKDANGTIVFPVITTISNKIRIYFIDGLNSNYVLYFV